MKIQYLGTAAAEGIPGIFCCCDTCERARKTGGKNIRTRSQALIDDKLLIDLPADTYMHSLVNNIDLSNIDNCLITHTHADHLYAIELWQRAKGFCKLREDKKIFNIYSSMGTALNIRGSLYSKMKAPADVVATIPINCYEPIKIMDYTVTALKAIHDVTSHPVFYMISDKEGKTLLYAHDTNYFCDEVWEYFEKEKPKFDFVSLDCTNANDPVVNYIGHMNLKDNVKVKERLIELGCADDNTIFCSNHFSHNGSGVLYEDFSKEAEKVGFLTSYDGMKVEF